MNSQRPVRPIGVLNRFVRDQRGVSAIIFALILPTLIGFVGLSVEVGLWYAKKRNLQAAADAGAMAGALDKAAGSSDATVTATATSFAIRNGFVAANGSIDVDIPPVAPSAYTGDATAVGVRLTENQTLLFAAVLYSGTVTVGARAVATAGGGQALGCVVALEASGNQAVDLNSNARINLTDCGLTVNSSSSTALYMDANSQVNADFARLTGNYLTQSNAEVNGTQSTDVVQPGTITTGQTATANPYADLANPATPATCTNTPSGGWSGTLTPGNYCGFSMNSNKTATMTAGTYYIKNGTFSMSSNTKLYADAGVTIILTGSAIMNLNSNAYIQITAPTSGTYEGIAIMQDPDGTGQTHTMNSNVYIGLKGAIYFPNALLHMDSNSTITTSSVMTSAFATTVPAANSATAGCGLVVTDKYHLDSNSRINLNNSSATCDTAGVPTTTPGGTVSLVE